MQYFLTSDLHLGHANIIKYCNRPFADVYHMSHEIIRRWNERVSEEDWVYHIGDFCFRNSSDERGEGTKYDAMHWLRKLKGQKVFIKGNHDRNNSLKTLITHLEIEYAGSKYQLIHNPQDVHTYPITFVGHVHERWKYRSYRGNVLINVGVDVNNFYPKTIDETLNEYKFWKKNNTLEEYVPYVSKS
jgi:calcineurin-like phosphoesterase family protein